MKTEANAAAQTDTTVKTRYLIVTIERLDPVWVAGAYWMSVPRAASLSRSRHVAGGTTSGGACRRSRHSQVLSPAGTLGDGRPLMKDLTPAS
jgi:hypothetical protein